MNVFHLEFDPVKAARMHCDEHVRKMLIEYAQMMSTAHRITNPNHPHLDQLYAETHANHKSNVWLRESKGNYIWLYTLWAELANLFERHSGKHHKSFIELRDILAHVPDLPDLGLTAFRQAMPTQFEHCNPIAAYREFYNYDKSVFAHFTINEKPFWYDPMTIVYALDYDPKICAQNHFNRHVTINIIKYAQILSAAHRVLDNNNDSRLSSTHDRIDQPWYVWAMHSEENYNWLYNLWIELCKVYTERFGKLNANETRASEILLTPPRNIKKNGLTEFPSVRNMNGIHGYRHIYMHEKSTIAKWTVHAKPTWWNV